MNGVERSNDGVVLKKCPFCNGEAITMGAFSISADCYIMCKTCGASIEKEVAWNGMTQEQHDEECKKVLINAWNNRKPVENVLERLEELFKYNSEQAEIYMFGDDSYMREKKEMYMDRANCYGVAIKIIKEGLE